MQVVTSNAWERVLKITMETPAGTSVGTGTVFARDGAVDPDS